MVARGGSANDIKAMLLRSVPLIALALVTFLAGAGTPALAQQTPQVCARIEDDAERLACYDAIFQVVGDVAGESILIESEQLIPASPTGRAPVSMTIACDAGQMRVSLRFAGNTVSNTGAFAPVTFQVDSRGTLVRNLSADASNTELSFAAGRESDEFLDSLVGGNNLRVRMTPVRQRMANVIFRLSERADEIAALRQACG